MKIWSYRQPPAQSPPDFALWAENLGISPKTVEILWLRGHTEQNSMDFFLEPRLAHLVQPEEWPGVEEAANLILDAYHKKERVVIWGDYDVDGVTSAVLLQNLLHFHGMDAFVHLPDRLLEGYGLNTQEIMVVAEQGAKLLVTVDCGISDVEEVAFAKNLGLRVVVTDHHVPPAILPKADVLCNPHFSPYLSPSLAGVGVIFFLAGRVNTLLAQLTGKKQDMKAFLDLVALGTLADMAKLEGQNRILVKHGLKYIAKPERPGIIELKVASGFSPYAGLGAGQVVFSLAPRLNAAGRVASAKDAFALLASTDHANAAKYAQILNEHNKARRQEEDKTLEEAMKQAAEYTNTPAFVLYAPHWNQGVIGIVASRIIEKYHKPTLILCADGETCKGSGRSVPGFDLHNALCLCEQHILSFGGHTMAAGVRVLEEKIPALRQSFVEIVQQSIGQYGVEESIILDADVDFAQASQTSFLQELELMQPFGIGNPEPVFASPPLLVKRRRVFGPQKNHVDLELYDTTSGIALHAKAWRQEEHFPSSLEGKTVRIAYSPSIDRYNGIASVDIKIKDLVEV